MTAFTAGEKFGLYWRSLFIQAAWSFKGMQTLGFAHTLGPALKGTTRARCDAMLRHLAFYNSHPFLATMIAGAAAKAEREGDEAGATEVRALLMGPVGGLGDAFFWGALKPFLVLAAILLVLLGEGSGVFLMVGAFLAANLWTRAWALNLGLTKGRAAILRLQALRPLYWATKLKYAQALMLGFIVWRLGQTGLVGEWGVSPLVSAGFAVLSTLFVAWTVRREVDPLWLIYSAALAAVGIGYLQ